MLATHDERLRQNIAIHGPWFLRLGLAVCLLALGLLTCWVLGEWRFQSGLRWAKAEVVGHRFDSRGSGLPPRRPGVRINLKLLSGSACASKRREVPRRLRSRIHAYRWHHLSCRRGLVVRRILIEDLGRYAEAEEILTAILSHAGRKAPDGPIPARYTLIQLLYWEGRLGEMRRILQEGWTASPDRAGDLRDLWMLDIAVLMIEKIRTTVDRAAAKAPDDDRVWLRGRTSRCSLVISTSQPGCSTTA